MSVLNLAFQVDKKTPRNEIPKKPLKNTAFPSNRIFLELRTLKSGLGQILNLAHQKLMIF